MNARTRFRQDFPQAWWRSPRWWGGATKQGASLTLAVFAPVLLLPQAVAAVKHRKSPAKLARINTEAFAYGLAASVLIPAVLVWALESQPGSLPVLIGMSVFQLLNFLVAATIVATVSLSWVRERATWAAIGFVEQHRAGDQQPPQTPGEYEAERMRALIAE